MAVTILEIAKKAGVSFQAVSQALNNTGRLSEATRRRVLKVAKELHYRPNALARSMASGKFGTAGLLLSTQHGRSTLPNSFLMSIHDHLAEQDIRLVINRLPDEELTREGFIPSLMRESACDGFLVNYTDHIPERMIELLEGFPIPVVWLNTKMEQDCVYPADYAAGRQATERLIELGHRDIAYCDLSVGWDEFDVAHYSIRERQKGYEHAMEAAELSPRIVRYDERVRGHNRPPAYLQFLAQPNPPTGLVTYSSAAGFTFMIERLGLRPGRDISVIGFGEGRHDYMGREISTMIPPYSELAHTAVEMYVRRLAEPKEHLPPREVPFTYVENDRCTGPAPQA